jgi:hypothetical protein
MLQLNSPRIFYIRVKLLGKLLAENGETWAFANARACTCDERLYKKLKSVPRLLLILNGGFFDASDRMNIVVSLIKSIGQFGSARGNERE